MTATLMSECGTPDDALAVKDPKPHWHYHMRPRYQQPVELAGRMFEAPDFGGMYDLEHRWKVDKDPDAAGLKDAVAPAVRDNLSTRRGLL